jgi:hypothetical protein
VLCKVRRVLWLRGAGGGATTTPRALGFVQARGPGGGGAANDRGRFRGMGGKDSLLKTTASARAPKAGAADVAAMPCQQSTTAAPAAAAAPAATPATNPAAAVASTAAAQGLTLVHFLAQRKHLEWVTPGGLSDSVTKKAQAQLRSGRV